MKIKGIYLFTFITSLVIHSVHAQVKSPREAKISVDLNEKLAEMKPIWAWFGYDEPNYTYMKDGKVLLTEIAEFSPVPVNVRAHSLLCTGDGTAALKWGSTNVYTEDTLGNPIYDWTIMDSIFDTYVDRGMRPLVQIGFMPEALSSKPQPYQHNWRPGIKYSEVFTGWAYPPTDYQKWSDLCYEWAQHCLERYGKEEVSTWYWEVWNEPDGGYWQGTQEEFHKLYDYAAYGVRRALPEAIFGGCNTTGGGTRFFEKFIKHCLYETNYATGETGAPLDVLLFHAKGSPKLVDGVVEMNVRNQLRNIDGHFAVIKKYPELQKLPIILGESDPEGCAACGMDTNPSNAYRNGTLYSSYTAASFARKYELALRDNLNLIGAVSWSFEFEDQPWFAGFRDLSTNQVNKPVLNVFRMYAKMSGYLVKSTSSHMYPLDSVLQTSIRKEADLGVLSAVNDELKENTIMVWNYHDNDAANHPTQCTITVDGIPSKKVRVEKFLVDENHSNSYTLWKSMGSPQSPTKEQITALKAEGNRLARVSNIKKMKVKNGQVDIQHTAEKQSVALFILQWK